MNMLRIGEVANKTDAQEAEEAFSSASCMERSVYVEHSDVVKDEHHSKIVRFV